MSKLKYLTSFSIIIFLYSGLFKWYDIGIDLTLLSSLILLILLLISNKSINNIKIIKNEIILLFFFGILYSLTSLYTVSESYFLEKVFYLWLAIFSFMLPALLLPERKNISAFFKTLRLLSLPCILMLLYLLITFQWYVFIIKQDIYENLPNYLAVGNFLAVIIIINFKPDKKINKIITLIALIFLILLSGRGPILGLIISYLVYFLISKRKTKIIVPLLLIGSILYLGFTQFKENYEVKNFTQRFENLTTGETNPRIDQAQAAFDIIGNNIVLGVGIGGYGIANANRDEFWHPHNIILEIFSESGVFISMIFIYFLFKVFWINNLNFKLNSITIIFFILAFYHIIQAMKSGGIPDMRITFFWIGLMTYGVKKFYNQTGNNIFE